jgi:triosephosphate isomerase
MKKYIVAGNWKMNLNIAQAQQLISQIEKACAKLPSSVQVVVAPTSFVLGAVYSQIVQNNLILPSAQNCATETEGAYTGEISAKHLADAKIPYVIIGHSERRSLYGETDEIIAKKVKQALHFGIKPIFCCGEYLEERQKGIHFDVVKNQIARALYTLSKEELSQVVIAYEPVWAIGTGVTASAAQAEEMHAYIRTLLVENWGKELASQIPILYGGSVKASNAVELFSQPNVNGGLIGGASLKAEEFCSIIQSTIQLAVS